MSPSDFSEILSGATAFRLAQEGMKVIAADLNGRPHRPSLMNNYEEMSMSTKPTRKDSTKQRVTKAQAQMAADPTGNSSPDDEIRRRAYEIYLERGDQPGTELDDWLQAELDYLCFRCHVRLL